MKMLKFLTCWLLATSLVWADEKVERIFAQARSINPGLQDYSATVEADLVTSVGPLSYKPKVKGTYFYKQAGQHRLEVLEGPKQLKKYPMIFGLNLPKLEDYHSSLLEDTSYEGRPVFHCHLVAKSADQTVTEVDLLVDKSNYTVPHTVTHFRDQGQFVVDVDYIQVGPYLLFDRMRAQGQFPSVSTTASGEVRYSHYLFNQHLSRGRSGAGVQRLEGVYPH
jgi:hypothetical protein